MPAREYRPRRASQRWLEGAPDYVGDVFDAGPDDPVVDRYTFVLWPPYTFDPWRPGIPVSCPNPGNTFVTYLACGPGGRGVSMFGEMTAADLARLRQSGRRVRWLDVPEETRRHVAARWEETEEES